MMDLNPETICYIIDKAHEFHVKEGVSIPEPPSSPTEDWAIQVLADHEDDMTYQELVSIINDLEPDQQVQLVALMWVGRGDFEVDDWDNAVEAAGDARTERTAQYLIATPMVADYLAEGLDLMGISCEER